MSLFGFRDAISKRVDSLTHKVNEHTHQLNANEYNMASIQASLQQDVKDLREELASLHFKIDLAINAMYEDLKGRIDSIELGKDYSKQLAEYSYSVVEAPIAKSKKKSVRKPAKKTKAKK